MTDRPDIEGILELAEKASPGPWGIDEGVLGKWPDTEDYHGIHANPDGWVCDMNASDFDDYTEANAAFIAKSRTALPEIARYALELEARIAALEGEKAELEKKLQPEHWWPKEWPESVYDGPDDYMSDLAVDAVGEFTVGCTIGPRWCARFCVSVDDESDWAETEVRTFESEDAAMRCWPESLAAARALLAKHNGEDNAE